MLKLKLHYVGHLMRRADSLEKILMLRKTEGRKKNMIRKDTYTPMFIAALFTIAKTWKHPKCPLTEEWIKKIRHTHTHTHTPQNITQPLKRTK